MIRTVLFDIDDTLLDFRGAMSRGLLGHLGEIAPDFTEAERAEASATWLAVEALHFGRYLRGELTFQQQRRARATDFCRRHELPIGSSAEQQDRWVSGYLAHCEAAFTLFPDVLPALDRLAEAGVRIGAMSNSTHAYQDRKLKLLGIREHFEALVCCDDVGGLAKPDPRIFLAACAATGTEPAGAVYVGDRRDTDAAAADQAGLHGVWLDRPGSPGGPGVDRVTDLHQLTELVLERRLSTAEQKECRECR